MLLGLTIAVSQSTLSFDMPTACTLGTRREFFVTSGIISSGAIYPAAAAVAGYANPDSANGAVAASSELTTQLRESNKNTADEECDEECKDRRRKRIEERRAMMRQSRSSTSRQEVFELSKQRAKLYGSEYKGTNCIEGAPCL